MEEFTASPATTKPLKHLSQLLQEQQEPFLLDVYLSERGFRRRKSSSDDGKEHKRKSLQGGRVSKLLRALWNTAVDIREKTRRRKEHSRNRGGARGAGVRLNTGDAAELFDGFSAACNPDGGPVEVPNTAVEPPPLTRETLTEQFNCQSQMRDFCSFSSVWPEDEDSMTSRIGVPKKTTEDSPSPSSTVEMLFRCKRDSSNFTWSAQPAKTPASGYPNSKRVLQQTKRLLFDCVREVIKTYGGQNGSKKSKNSVVAPQEIEKIICENIVRWERARGNEQSIDELLDLHYSETVDEWEDCIDQRTQISLETGDALMEDIFIEIIADMMMSLTAHIAS